MVLKLAMKLRKHSDGLLFKSAKSLRARKLPKSSIMLMICLELLMVVVNCDCDVAGDAQCECRRYLVCVVQPQTVTLMMKLHVLVTVLRRAGG